MQTIALIGATSVAEQIAARALRAKLQVVIDDVSDARLQATSIHLHDVVGAQIYPEASARRDCCAPGPQDQTASATPGFSSPGAAPNLFLTQSIESAIRFADFLIDTLPDDLEVKLELFTLFDKFAKPNAIFITTGSIPIDDLAAITFCPDRCLAVQLTPSANAINSSFRLIPGAQTSPQTLATCADLFSRTFNFPQTSNLSP
ncbi:MAG: hypothetical protein JO119_06460 [Acidobacteria bacterium]|nr:hypothetical protein [Acidobacteriota bacterium]